MPATKNEDVMAMVRDELKKNRDVATDALFEKAKKMDSSLEELSLRQFHARYPLQVKRQMSSKKKKRNKSKSRKKRSSRKKRGRSSGDGTGEAGREAIRDGLLTFAKDVAGADNRADLISVLTSVDDYVDDVVTALDRAAG